MQNHHLNTETLTEECSCFLAMDLFSLQDQTVSQGRCGWGGGSRKGSASPPHHLSTQSLEGTAPVWPRLPRRLQWLSAEPSAAFQGRQLDEALGIDANPVYCVYYAAASGVTYLNPRASQRGEAPRAMPRLSLIFSMAAQNTAHGGRCRATEHAVCTEVTQSPAFIWGQPV